MPDEKFDETDAVLARKLAEITPPADLRARLLASALPPAERSDVVEAPTRSGNWLIGGILAAAATLVLSLFLLGEWAHRGESLSAATADLSKFLSGGFDLTMQTSNVNQVRQWLAANNPKHPVSVPSALAKNQPMGCRKLMWRGHAGSLACFKMGSGREAHLAMFSSKAFSDAPGATPQIASAGNWTRAAWSQDGMTYLLFVPAGMDPMKVLAGVFAAQRLGMIASSSRWSRAWADESVSSFTTRISSAV